MPVHDGAYAGNLVPPTGESQICAVPPLPVKSQVRGLITDLGGQAFCIPVSTSLASTAVNRNGLWRTRAGWRLRLGPSGRLPGTWSSPPAEALCARRRFRRDRRRDLVRPGCSVGGGCTSSAANCGPAERKAIPSISAGKGCWLVRRGDLAAAEWRTSRALRRGWVDRPSVFAAAVPRQSHLGAGVDQRADEGLRCAPRCPRADYDRAHCRRGPRPGREDAQVLGAAGRPVHPLRRGEQSIGIDPAASTARGTT